jgi:hypothetical protein
MIVNSLTSSLGTLPQPEFRVVDEETGVLMDPLIALRLPRDPIDVSSADAIQAFAQWSNSLRDDPVNSA